VAKGCPRESQASCQKYKLFQTWGPRRHFLDVNDGKDYDPDRAARGLRKESGNSSIALNHQLNWYSSLPPQFGDMRVNNDFDGQRYSARVTRGPMSSARYNIKDDPQQERNRYAEPPEIVERLKSSLLEFLTSINAPREQLIRLG
jgi:hypothetical protein